MSMVKQNIEKFSALPLQITQVCGTLFWHRLQCLKSNERAYATVSLLHFSFSTLRGVCRASRISATYT